MAMYTGSASGFILSGLEATKALDNLSSVAINTSLISDTTNTDDLGSATIAWKTTYTREINVDAGTLTITPATSCSSTLGVTGLITATAGITTGSTIISDTDNTDALGSAAVTWTTVYTRTLSGGSGGWLGVASTLYPTSDNSQACGSGGYRWGTIWSTQFLCAYDANTYLNYQIITEDLTIPVGQGAAGVDSSTTHCYKDSVILCIKTKVITAPGGGATTFDLGRKAGNLDEFVNDSSTAVDTESFSTHDGDGSITAPFYQGATGAKLTLTTNANVTDSAMVVRIATYRLTMK